MSTFIILHPSYIVSLSSVLLKLIQFRLLYIVYAAGLTSETTFRKKLLYNILYKLLQLFWPVEKYLCFKRHVGPIVQKGQIVNTSLSWGQKQTWFYTTDCTHRPSIPWNQQYTFHEKYTPPYQIQRRQNIRTWI